MSDLLSKEWDLYIESESNADIPVKLKENLKSIFYSGAIASLNISITIPEHVKGGTKEIIDQAMKKQFEDLKQEIIDYVIRFHNPEDQTIN